MKFRLYAENLHTNYIIKVDTLLLLLKIWTTYWIYLDIRGQEIGKKPVFVTS